MMEVNGGILIKHQLKYEINKGISIMRIEELYTKYKSLFNERPDAFEMYRKLFVDLLIFHILF